MNRCDEPRRLRGTDDEHRTHVPIGNGEDRRGRIIADPKGRDRAHPADVKRAHQCRRLRKISVRENAAGGCAQETSNGTRGTQRDAIDAYRLTRGFGRVGVLHAVILPVIPDRNGPARGRLAGRLTRRPAGRRIQ